MQRLVLLLVGLAMAGTAAVAGALTVRLLSRAAPPEGAMPLVAAGGARPWQAPPTAALPPVRQPDPIDALNAALGRPAAPRAALDDAAFAGLFAVPDRPVGTATPVAAPVGVPVGAPAAAAPTASGPAASPPPLPSGYALDLGYFLVPEQAAAFATQLQERGIPAQLLALPDASGRVWTHVRTPPFAGSAQALVGAARIERDLGLVVSLVPPTTAPPSQPPLTGAPRP